ncbi:DUF58 domain-containing protein [Halopiger aswanensis]|uniref:Putative repeat protein (TIGR01451 family) n=1 Tax=Halopiger aswanensis TaxID=148449 RepID=A0A3R7DA20_9EURY|nr:DUF58 domain-containing protein [Halopiger aswanensis]RKD95228.1 putative repeat protein (TIGR01451 family) [Halopiger aswanensis]
MTGTKPSHDGKHAAGRSRGLALAFFVVLGGVIVLLEPTLVPDVGVPMIAVAALAVLAFGLGAFRLRRGLRNRSVDGRGWLDESTSDRTAPAPGDDWYRRLRSVAVGAATERKAVSPEAITADLAELAGTVLETESTSDRRPSPRDDSWTDDPYARALCTGEPYSLREHLRWWLTRTSPFSHRVVRFADELSARAADRGDREASGFEDRSLHRSDPDADPVDGVRSKPADPSDRAPSERDDVDVLVQRTGRWNGVGATAVAFGLLALGIVARNPGLLLASACAVVAAVLVRFASPPPAALEIERRFEPPEPEYGDEVDVTVTVTNAGSRILPDVRLVDAVPPGVPVLDGVPRAVAALRPGASTSFTYTVSAGRGRHRFGPLRVRYRDWTGGWERLERTTVDSSDGASEREFACLASIEPAEGSLESIRATGYPGTTTVSAAGSGTAFHSLREYRRGDPVNRIDWRHRAKTGRLATKRYHDDRRPSFALAVDARRAARRTDSTGRSTVDRTVAIAGTLAATLLADRSRVGIQILGPESVSGVPVDRGRVHRERLERVLSFDETLVRGVPGNHRVDAGSVADTDREVPELDLESTIADLLDGIAPGTQVIVVSPLTDDGVVEIIERLSARNRPLFVVSPDPTYWNDPVRALAGLERLERLDRLRTARIPVLDIGRGTADDIVNRLRTHPRTIA